MERALFKEVRMKLFLDCEFNGFGGELISMALVDEQENYFYEALACLEPIAWVKENVISQLNKVPVSQVEFERKLSHFLRGYDTLHVIADWPEDLSLFTRALITSPGSCMVTPPLVMALWIDNSIQVDSIAPHNALADAQALRQAHMNYSAITKP